MNITQLFDLIDEYRFCRDAMRKWEDEGHYDPMDETRKRYQEAVDAAAKAVDEFVTQELAQIAIRVAKSRENYWGKS